MVTKPTRSVRILALLCLLLISAGSGIAQVEDDRSGLGEKEFRLAELNIVDSFQSPRELPEQAAAQASADLADLGLDTDSGRLDTRGGRWGTLVLRRPLIPGRGVGNNPVWPNGPPRNDAALKQATWEAFAGFLESQNLQLRIDVNELTHPGIVTAKQKGSLVQIHGPRVVDGIPVRDSYLTAVINHGNLVLFGAKRWGNINVSRRPQISEEEALAEIEIYLDPYRVTGFWGSNHLALVPLARGHNPNEVSVGQGYNYRLVWALRPSFDGELRRYEALVDAHTGELISFVDTNHYASDREVKGGVFPITNDGSSPGGIEYSGWPMPFDNITTESGTVTTDSGGNLPFPVNGTISSSLSGKYIRISDNCGPIDLSTSSDVLDFGTSGGTDCATPGFGGLGNTHSSRTGFFELNRINEMARSHLPGNAWLNRQLTANMNIVDTCNAYWNGGTVNFFRSGDGCGNTGEIAAVFDHEWGHGMDDNDANQIVSNPGEGIADIYAYLRLGNSCIGQGFSLTDYDCFGGFGDACLLCSGVRDIDYEMRVSGQPHDVAWIDSNCPGDVLRNGPCGGVVHCEGAVYAEAIFDLANRDLPSPPYNMDSLTAHEVVTRLTFAGATNVGNWFQCTTPYAGCGADSGYLNYLAADDDNGDLDDGTPHMTAIYDAFNRHGIACDNLTVQDSGCSGIPTTAPNLLASPLDKSANLSWNSVPGATSYQVFRTDTDALYGCDFGKIKVGETAATTFSDSGLQNGRSYSYIVIPIGGSDTCMGPASNCAPVQPVPGPNLDIDTGSTVLAMLTGDGDAFLDNCEEAQLELEVTNTGVGELTDVRIVNVTPVSHPETTIIGGFPKSIATTLAEDTVAAGSFNFVAGGLAFNETLTFQIEVTANELEVNKAYDLTVEFVEKDFAFYPSVTWDFETGFDDWTTIEGTFSQSSPGGADGSSGYMASSANLDNQCDHIRSPVMLLDPTSTLSMWTNFDIEPYRWPNPTYNDRANIGIFDSLSESRAVITPDSGRLYVIEPDAGGTCGTQGQGGWAEARPTWEASNWSQGALNSAFLAGKQVQLDIRYGTDAYVSYEGFWFDKVTVTNVQTVGPDTHSDSCNISCASDAECNDGLFCNGVETCGGSGTCQAGALVSCDDTVACTLDSCNEETDTCAHIPNDVICQDGLFCNGAETCDEVQGCVTGFDSCPGQLCDESSDSCAEECLDHADCDDGLFCNGLETCGGGGICEAGTPVSCDDGIACTLDSCNEAVDACDHLSDDAICQDGLFCNGVETCDAAQGCLTGGDPCSGLLCDEANDSCEGDPDFSVDTTSAQLTISGGDGDESLDNCEQGLLNFDVINTGLGELTNVRIVSVTPASHPETMITSSLPQRIAGTLAEDAVGVGSFDFIAGGMSYNETLVLQVEVAADEVATNKTYDLKVEFVEKDVAFYPSITWDFETGFDDWTTIQGTFDPTSPGGADGSSGYVASSARLANQCDLTRSPVMILSTTSTLSIWTNFDIEPYRWPNPTATDRANVGVYEISSENRSMIEPDSGRLYNLAPDAGGTCGTQGQGGWNETRSTWEPSTWSPGAFNSAVHAGKPIQLDIRYGTDLYYNYEGFWFDKVTVTDVETVGPDTSPDFCNIPCSVDAECDDGLSCNGVETCGGNNTCQAGSPVSCDDGIACTVDSCNEWAGSCDHVPNNAGCEDGTFCNGVEVCDVVQGCVSGFDPCPGQLCDESSDSCAQECLNHADCDDGVFCNGVETCGGGGICEVGTPVSCDDGIACTLDSCNEAADACDHMPDDAICQDGLFCNGVETCDAAQGCLTGTDPCSGLLCDETNDSCEGDPDFSVDTTSAQLTISGGDGDEALDNCEQGLMNFDVSNTGLGELTNVRIVNVTPVSHPETTITTGFPKTVAATLDEDGVGIGSFDFLAGGLSFNETLVFQVEVAADEIAESKLYDLTVDLVEKDFAFYPSVTWDFETGFDDWTTIQGTFNQSSPGGAEDSNGFVASSANLDNQCDHVRSPVMILDATSTLSMWTNFDIEPYRWPNPTSNDRANIGVYEVSNESRTVISPDGGRFYVLEPDAGGTCGTQGQGGWNDARPTWEPSNWSQGALNSAIHAGKPIQLDIRYGTDAFYAYEGFWFDKVTVTNVQTLGPDTSPDSCSVSCSLDADCDDGNVCTDDSCDPGSGCVYTDNAASCDDGDACTTVDACSGGVCVGGAPETCEDGNVCNGVESCDPSSGCLSGTPLTCDDGDACTTDSCDPATGCTTDPIVCDDGDACTTDSCDSASGCTTDPIVCDDGDACTTDSCDSATGCTTDPIVCDDGDACTTDSCDSAAGCTADPIVCDDGDACTTDSCDSAAGCTTDPIVCDDGDVCTDDSCDPGAGCVFTNNDACAACDFDTVCEEGEDCTSCPSDCITGSTPAAACGNGICEAGNSENCLTCPEDCRGKQVGSLSRQFCCGDGGGDKPIPCFDGDSTQCNSDGFSCTDQPQQGENYCCGDSTCEGAEDSVSCSVDCGAPAFCGDGTCDPDEDQCTCLDDCGDPPADETGLCEDGIDNNCDGLVDCEDSSCTDNPVCVVVECLPKGSPCEESTADQCCSGTCRRTRCK